MKKKLFIYTIIGIIFVSVAGTILHSVYEMSGQNYIAGLFAPVNESVWEHMKLLFFPMLLFAIFAAIPLKLTYPRVISALCAGIFTGTALIPTLFYTYSGILGYNHHYIDIAIFFVSVIAAFIILYKTALSGSAHKHSGLLAVLILLLIALFLVFSYSPPSLALFQTP